MSIFSAPAFDSHELVTFGRDEATGLRAIIAVHSTTLGPAVGGCRMFPYVSEDDALHDVLRLSRGMTYKSALAGLPFGGGKSVIIGDSRKDKTPELIRAMGDFVHSQGGRYVAAEDSGTGVADIRLMAERTPHVSGMDDNEFGGDPSPSTAWGVFISIRAAVRHRLGQSDTRGVRVALQGLGHVGYYLAKFLVADGAEVVAADVNQANIDRAVADHGIHVVDPGSILSEEADVFAPCAMGAVLNVQSIEQLRAGIVAGAANNQLATEQDGARLMDRGILYCPDFLINAGGIIDVHHQRVGSTEAKKREHVNHIEHTLSQVLTRADESHRETNLIAETLAEDILHSARSKPLAA
ncbi:amino acid dehydrogenase [Halioglobus japonicus]|uniref:Glu/Leu/Phe/Val dehydrogenase n=1 Tax=Halioglobus japonicus TaxID=930805 RepID=A0AAP8MFS0_9GAMM|nr:Glu/Leu/Phe/Val dehydrogenase dimerization domain-containing protein [Halioglobus japonicus]AQA19869.1 amino acid dehydrogenase [Halioglobus japonicus]PLW87055.1 Glu/Leu/Phe/Val dehydrogenase [Halioglobus japonicus]GHD10449.1 leucine dehydrogenase [Halioglobus japonicus]